VNALLRRRKVPLVAARPPGRRGVRQRFVIVESRYHRRMAMDSTTGTAVAGSGLSQLEAAAALFRGLSDRTRLAIVRRLAGGPARVVDLVGELSLAQSTISAHMACLRDCGLVEGSPRGRQVIYSLARPELWELLAAAESVLAATGNAVAICPNYGANGRRSARAESAVEMTQ
jgi:ArsR family transcriptional regulator, cadmium/lead-responsive transcriptional repressor